MISQQLFLSKSVSYSVLVLHMHPSMLYFSCLQAGLTYFTLVVLVRGSAQTGVATYSQLVGVTCGRAATKVLQLSVLSFCFGFSVVYLVRKQAH
jgi:hypothetical protein